MPAKLRLVASSNAPIPPDRGIIDALERLLEIAHGPGLDGLAFVALEKGTGYSADVLGCIHDHPLFTLTLVRELEEAVRAQTRKK